MVILCLLRQLCVSDLSDYRRREEQQQGCSNETVASLFSPPDLSHAFTGLNETERNPHSPPNTLHFPRIGSATKQTTECES